MTSKPSPHPLNSAIRSYFKENGIKLVELAKIWNIQPSSVSKKIDSPNCITIDEWMLLFERFEEGILPMLEDLYPFYAGWSNDDRVKVLEIKLKNAEELMKQTMRMKEEQDKLIAMLGEKVTDSINPDNLKLPKRKGFK